MVVIQRSEEWLEHHGIKGQRWGKMNGPPYPLDYDDHSAAQKKANPKSELNNYENNNATAKTKALNKKEAKEKKVADGKTSSKRLNFLIEKGLTEEQAKEQIKFEKRAVAIAAVAAVAIGAGVTYNLVQNNNLTEDFMLSSGTKMFRVASSDSTEMRDMFYATINKADAKKYAGLYANQLIRQGRANIYQKVLSPKSDIKIAGSKTGERVFNELKKDPNFIRQINPVLLFTGNADEQVKEMYKNLSYDQFNKETIMQQKNKLATKMFFDALQSQGYGGLIDINDAKYSGYEANRPLILFNQQNNINVNSVRKLSGKEIISNTDFARKRIIAQQFIKNNSDVYMKTVASLSGLGLVAAGKSYLSSMATTTEIESVNKEPKKNIEK